MLAQTIGDCFSDPLRYVQLAFPWGEGELEGHDGPDTWQADILSEIGRGVLTAEAGIRIAVASGHRIGKSALVAWLILWAMSTRPNLAGVITANTGTQLETKTWRELSIWHGRAINSNWFKWTATKFHHVDYPETWFVAAIPWSKERSEAFAGLQSKYVLILYDEASAIDDVIWEVSEGAQGAIWCVFGNPTRNTGRFRECFGRFRHRWITRQIDSQTARMANKKQIEQWVQDYGEDSDFVRVRARGIFPRAGANQFIGSDIVEAAQRRVPEGYGPMVLGVDVARFGDDQSVVCLRQGDRAEIIGRWRGLDTMQTAAQVYEKVELYRPDALFVDGVGVGGGVVDRLKQMKLPAHLSQEVNAGARARDERKYYNKRAEMWGEMRAWLQKRGALPPFDRDLADDLMAPEYGFDNTNRIQLEKKEDMKKRGLASPDAGDALALTFAGPAREGAFRDAGVSTQALTDYDPWN